MNSTHFEDLPLRDSNHNLEARTKLAFRSIIEKHNLFLIKNEDENDYGVDIVAEAMTEDSVTNFRICFQLKGTNKKLTSNGSLSISISRTNLNYLLGQPFSLYICYHVPSDKIFARFAEDVYVEYEHKGPDWRSQKNISVKFFDEFDESFQKSLHKKVLSRYREDRNRRIAWATIPPGQVSVQVEEEIPAIKVPSDHRAVEHLILELYEDGRDDILSAYFDECFYSLKKGSQTRLCLYMAEFNLGINGQKHNKERVMRGVQVFEKILQETANGFGEILYNLANGYSVLGEPEKAAKAYMFSAFYLKKSREHLALSQCYHNLGTLVLADGDKHEALYLFNKALKINPDLAQAKTSIAMLLKDNFPEKALPFIDDVLEPTFSKSSMYSIIYWKIHILFDLEQYESGFRELFNLINLSFKNHNALGWCGHLVREHEFSSVYAARKSIKFWHIFLKANLGKAQAVYELILCVFYLKSKGEETSYSSDNFVQYLDLLEEEEAIPTALAYDRLGHIAQYEDNWTKAEFFYGKAYELRPDLFSYCFSVSLIFLNKYKKALEVLEFHMKHSEVTEQSWFQLAVARGNTGDDEGCIFAYKKAISLDPDYELAWFNLGGQYWNLRQFDKAILTWLEATEKFPSSEEIKKLPWANSEMIGSHQN